MSEAIDELPQISKKKLRSIANDEEKTARAANLIYVTDKNWELKEKRKEIILNIFSKSKKLKMMKICCVSNTWQFLPLGSMYGFVKKRMVICRQQVMM